MSSNDLILWPCGTWCFRRELSEFSHMGHDYRVVFVDTDDYISTLFFLG